MPTRLSQSLAKHLEQQRYTTKRGYDHRQHGTGNVVPVLFPKLTHIYCPKRGNTPLSMARTKLKGAFADEAKPPYISMLVLVMLMFRWQRSHRLTEDIRYNGTSFTIAYSRRRQGLFY